MSTWKCKKWKLNSLVLCFKSIQSLLSVCRFFSSFLQFYFPMGSIHHHIFIVFYTIFSTTTPQHFSTNSYIDTTIHFRDQRWDFSATNQGLGSEYSTVERSWVFSLFFSHLSQLRETTVLLTWITFCFSNKSTVTKPYSCCTPKALTKSLNQPMFSICRAKEKNKAFTSILYGWNRSLCDWVPCRVVNFCALYVAWPGQQKHWWQHGKRATVRGGRMGSQSVHTVIAVQFGTQSQVFYQPVLLRS